MGKVQMVFQTRLVDFWRCETAFISDVATVGSQQVNDVMCLDRHFSCSLCEEPTAGETLMLGLLIVSDNP